MKIEELKKNENAEIVFDGERGDLYIELDGKYAIAYNDDYYEEIFEIPDENILTDANGDVVWFDAYVSYEGYYCGVKKDGKWAIIDYKEHNFNKDDYDWVDIIGEYLETVYNPSTDKWEGCYRAFDGEKDVLYGEASGILLRADAIIFHDCCEIKIIYKQGDKWGLMNETELMNCDVDAEAPYLSVEKFTDSRSMEPKFIVENDEGYALWDDEEQTDFWKGYLAVESRSNPDLTEYFYFTNGDEETDMVYGWFCCDEHEAECLNEARNIYNSLH